MRRHLEGKSEGGGGWLCSENQQVAADFDKDAKWLDGIKMTFNYTDFRGKIVSLDMAYNRTSFTSTYYVLYL